MIFIRAQGTYLWNKESRRYVTEKEDYNLIELDKVLSTEARVTLSLFDRRLEVYGNHFAQAIQVPRIRDNEGEIIADFAEPYEAEVAETTFGVELDFTDNKQDPL